MIRRLLIILLLLPSAALADRIELSYLRATGNQDVTTAYGRLDYSSKRDVHEYSFLSEAHYHSDEKDSYLAEFTGKRYVTDNKFVSMLYGWENNEYAGYIHKYYLGPGIGAEYMDKKLILAAMFMYGEDKFTDDTRRVNRSVRFEAKYRRPFADKFLFSQDIKYTRYINEPILNYFTAKTQVETGGRLALGVSYEYKFQSQPAADIKNSDHLYRVLLIWRFKDVATDKG
jgi:putative salt-induced outer membrane protein YdiY